MFKKHCIFLAILLFGLAFSDSSQAKGEVNIFAKTDKKKVTVGEKLVLTVRLQWTQVENAEIRIAKIAPPECPLLELTGSTQASDSELHGGKVVLNQTLTYIFKAKKEGIDKISALTVEYIVEGDEQKLVVNSEPIEVKVVSLKEKLISTFGLMAAIAGGILTSILGAFLLLRRRRKRQNSAVLDKVTDTCCEREAVDRLQEITKYRLAGDFKKYYGSLQSVLADYTKAKHHIEIENKNEEEIRKLSSEVNLPGELLRLLIETVRFSEKVRFAGYEVSPNEERKIFSNVQRYLKLLIPKENEEQIELVKGDKNEEV